MLVLLNVQRQAGKFKIQVEDGKMELALRNGRQDFVFEINKSSAIELYNAIGRSLELNAGSVPCTIHCEGVTLKFRFQLDEVHCFVDVEVDTEGFGVEIVFPLISFRVGEIINLQRLLEKYWKIFPKPALGDILGNAIDDGWADSILWNFPESAVRVFVDRCISRPSEWQWVNDAALVVAFDDGDTCFAIQYRDGNFAWLTKSFA